MAEADAVQPLVSMLDICVLGGVAAACLYFFVFKQKKKVEPAEFKRLAPLLVSQPNHSFIHFTSSSVALPLNSYKSTFKTLGQFKDLSLMIRHLLVK